jgi:hypothetical protein
MVNALKNYGDDGLPLNVWERGIYASKETFDDVVFHKARGFENFIKDVMVLEPDVQRVKGWAVYTYNRGGLGTAGTPMKDRHFRVMTMKQTNPLSPASGHSFTTEEKMVHMDLTSVIYTNLPTLAENIEEWLMLYQRDPFVIKADYGDGFGIIDVNVSILQESEFVRLEEEKFGAVTAIRWKSVLSFPIFFERPAWRNERMIMAINFKLIPCTTFTPLPPVP